MNRRGLKVDLNTLSVRNGYDGLEDFEAKRAGQATFKNRKPESSKQVVNDKKEQSTK